MALSPADRIALGLDEPGEQQHASEFSGAATAGAMPARPAPNLRLLLKEGDRATTPKIRTMLNELIAGNVDNANYWLQQVAAGSPKIALELYIELAQFSLPKLKAVAVQIDDKSDNPRRLSFEELQRTLVSDQ
jgi:hypothetical protein